MVEQMPEKKRLIEFAFPFKQTSIDSVYEKNVHHGHISTLHIWPTRRPLAAFRANGMIYRRAISPGTRSPIRRSPRILAGAMHRIPGGGWGRLRGQGDIWME
jgi:putative DNA methylase